MQDPTRPSDTPSSGEHERHLALSTLVQHGTYVVSTAVMLVVITALARTLEIAAFGVYGLVVSFSAYLLVAQGALEAATVRVVAQAEDAQERNRVFSMAAWAYLVIGALVALAIAGGGNLVLNAFNVPAEYHRDARIGLVILGLVSWLGWPLKTFQDVQRGMQLFSRAAGAEAIAYLLFGALMAALMLVDAPLWAFIGAGGSIPAIIGLISMASVRRHRVGLRYRHRTWSRDELREFLHLSRGLLFTSLADLFIYALDRVILGFFRPAATVARYEGPVRAHNVIRQVQGLLALTVLPAGSRYFAEGDHVRVRELVIRGTRYTLLASLPLIVVFMVLAKPILSVWLGPSFATDQTAAAMTILVGYWLVAANTNVSASMLLAAGRVRSLARYAWAVALANLALSLALTPSLGLIGVVLGTCIPYVLSFPIFLAMVRRWLPVTLRDLARQAWVPAYAIAVVAAVALLAVRQALHPTSTLAVLGLAATGLAGAWLLAYVVALGPAERRLVRDVAGHILHRAAGVLHVGARAR